MYRWYRWVVIFIYGWVCLGISWYIMVALSLSLPLYPGTWWNRPGSGWPLTPMSQILTTKKRVRTITPWVHLSHLYAFILRKHQTWLAFLNPRTSHLGMGKSWKIRIFSSKNWWIFQLACAIMPPMLIPMMCTFSLERSGDVFKETGDSTAGSAINMYISLVHIISSTHTHTSHTQI